MLRQETPISRALLRILLRQLILTDPDFDAFCLDRFSEVQRRFAHGMDRLSKSNLLLEIVEPSSVLEQLVQHFGKVEVEQAFQRISPTTDISQGQEVDALRDRLEHLYVERARRQAAGQNISELNNEITRVKRQQRQKPQLREGEVLGDRYRLAEVLGRGGFAKVWHAFDRETKQFVAVKVLHSEQAEDESRLERFRRGALKIKGLQHPSLIRVLDGPAEENGFHYFVMEFLAGGDLHNAILKQRITTAEALRIIIQSGRALEYVHSQGLIHRDVKPQNILLDVRNNPRLTDFDLVLAADSTGGTRTGGMGTYLYAAPEEMNDASRVDGRADVYSLGMTALFVINKQPITQVNLLRRDSFIDQLDCSMSIRQALHLATAIDASDRQPTVAAFCDSLEKAIASPNQVNFLDSSQPFVSSTLPQQVLINASSRAADNLVQPQPALGHVVSEERNITASVILDEHASPKKPAYWYRRTTILAIGFVLLISVLVLVQKAVRIWISPSTPSKFPDDACIGNDKCKEFYNNGMVAYKAELYDKALSDFQHAYEIKQLPIMLVNIGRVLQKLGRPKEALDYYQRFERAEPKAHPETKKRVDEYIAQVRALIGPN